MTTTDLISLSSRSFTVATALLVVLNKNAVNAAMFLLLSLVGLAGLFVLLDAYRCWPSCSSWSTRARSSRCSSSSSCCSTPPRQRQPAFKPMTIAASALAAALLALGLWSLTTRGRAAAGPRVRASVPTIKNYADQLFTTYLLPVQVVGFLLLIAMLGVIVLSKPRSGRREDVK
jgi:NADH-quinone oxidoreductase subunit J